MTPSRSTLFLGVVLTAFSVAAPVTARADDTGRSAQMPGSPAGKIPDSTITKAGSALHDVSKVQQEYEARMQSAAPEQKQGLSDQANAAAMQAITARGLSVDDYVGVLKVAQSDPSVKKRLLDAAQKTR
ncbi:MAG TPA: DUF4168 domain-containing protein [Acetobacteraceae bacterium]|jgi:hypothetical protein